MRRKVAQVLVVCGLVYFAWSGARAAGPLPIGCTWWADENPSPCMCGLGWCDDCCGTGGHWDCSAVGGPAFCRVLSKICQDGGMYGFDSCNCPNNPWTCT